MIAASKGLVYLEFRSSAQLSWVARFAAGARLSVQLSDKLPRIQQTMLVLASAGEHHHLSWS